MDIKTGLSIYNKQWLIQQHAAIQLLDFWDKVKAGEIKWDYRSAKGESESADSTYKIYQKFFASSGVAIAPESSWDMAEFKGFDGAEIAVIPISGPLMKNDFCGSFGTNTLKQLTRMASNTESVKCIIFPIDSPGGTVDGTKAFADEIKGSSKKTIAYGDELVCSAAYWIGSACDEFYAATETSIIGCIGTMISLRDRTEADKKNGIVSREYYADDSENKNKAFNEAIKGNGKMLIKELLNPMNDSFLGSVRANRPGVNEEALSGSDYTANAALKMGLIDGIKSFDEIVKQETKPITESIFYNNSNTKKMTLQEIEKAHPESYKEILTLGATQERERIEGWLVWQPTDADAVAKGISTPGAQVTPKILSEMSFKLHSKASLKQAENENAPEVETGEAKPQKTAASLNEDAYYEAVAKQMGVKTKTA